MHTYTWQHFWTTVDRENIAVINNFRRSRGWQKLNARKILSRYAYNVRWRKLKRENKTQRKFPDLLYVVTIFSIADAFADSVVNVSADDVDVEPRFRTVKISTQVTTLLKSVAIISVSPNKYKSLAGGTWASACMKPDFGTSP